MQVEVEVHVCMCLLLAQHCVLVQSQDALAHRLCIPLYSVNTHTLNALYITTAPVYIYTHIIIHVHYIIHCVLLIALRLSLPCSIVSLTDYYKRDSICNYL